jgi:phosphoribosyl 1,2-cyclic phosphodiesterase
VTDGLAIEVHGARGSTGVSGPAFARHGGNTTCFAAVLADGYHLIVDAGTGLGRVQAGWEAGPRAPFEGTLLLTHFHWDHIQGLPTFAPLFDTSTRLHIVASPPPGVSIEEALDGAIRPPWFPVRFRDVPARVTYEEAGEAVMGVGGVQVTATRTHHPGGALGFRIAYGDRALLVATDHEGGDPRHDAALRSLAEGATVLLHDAQYTPAEYAAGQQGRGHSTWEHAVGAASAARVERLILTSHDPQRTDEQVDAIVAAARGAFPRTKAAAEGQRIIL